MTRTKIRNVFFFLCLFAIAETTHAQETSHFQFVSEYVRELSALEDLRASAEQEPKGKDTNSTLANGIRYSTRVQLELQARIGILSNMRLNPPFEKLIDNIVAFYKQKIDLHQQLMGISSALMAGPKPNVDYGSLAADAPKISATLEYVDQSLFKATPLVFATLIDEKPDAQGHMSRLVITKEQRKQLVTEISNQFGSKLDQKNQNYYVSSASVLKGYLLKDYKSSDDPR